jgi:Family of unknown function (DUF5681)
MSDDVIARPGRPPRKGQFRPGQSGNLKGRPKGSRNIRTYVIKLLDAKIPVIEGGKTRTITRAEAIAIQYVNLAAKGDPKSLAAVLNMTREFDDATGEGRSSALMRIEDDEVMEGIHRPDPRWRRALGVRAGIQRFGRRGHRTRPQTRE